MPKERLNYLASSKNDVCLEHFYRGNHAKNVIWTECRIYPCTCLFDASIKHFIIMYNIRLYLYTTYNTKPQL